MAYHSLASCLFHCVFSTKNRLPLIPQQSQSRLWAYMGGIARTNDFTALAVGGISDHVHLLLSLPPTLAVAKAIQLVKAGSSTWLHERSGTRFEWQVGYGAFSIGVSQVAATTRYIQNQAKHHARQTFAQEWKIFLQRHGLEEFSRP
jgi:putative transposase